MGPCSVLNTFPICVHGKTLAGDSPQRTSATAGHDSLTIGSGIERNRRRLQAKRRNARLQHPHSLPQGKNISTDPSAEAPARLRAPEFRLGEAAFHSADATFRFLDSAFHLSNGTLHLSDR